MSSDSLKSEIFPKVNDLTPEEENQLEKNLVWIFGGRRSGTTWLGKQLLSHKTHYIHEPTLADHLGVQRNPGTNELVRRIDVRKGFKNYFFAEAYKNTWLHYLRKLILHRIYAQINDLTKKIIVKEPTTLLDISDIISECMPSCKIIFLIRDGRDMIDSLLDARQEGGWLAKTKNAIIQKKQRPSFIQRRAKIWLNQTENLLKTYQKSPKENGFLVKYEKLRKNTFEISSEIYSFLNIDISEAELKAIITKFSYENIKEDEKGKGKFIRSASPGKWKENFSDNEKKIMNDVMGKMLNSIGYD